MKSNSFPIYDSKAHQSLSQTTLLVDAAEAVCYQISSRLIGGGLMVRIGKNRAPKKWNPFANRSDTYKLAYDLKMFIDFQARIITVPVFDENGDYLYSHNETWIEDDKDAVAVVKAAAHVGKKKRKST